MNGTPRQLVALLCIILTGIPDWAGAQPQWQWGKNGGSSTNSTAPGISGPEEVREMVTDKNGNLYVLARNNRGLAHVDNHPGIGMNDQETLVSWDCNGNFRWMKNFGSGSTCSALSLKADTVGGIYVAGILTSNTGNPAGYFDIDTTMPYSGERMFLLKYDTTGTFQWINRPQPDTATFTSGIYTASFGMDVAPNGDIYLFSHLARGNYNGTSYIVATPGFHVMKYNRAGIFQSGFPIQVTVPADAYGPVLTNLQYARFSRDHRNGRFYLYGQYFPDWGTLTFGSTAINAAPAGIGIGPMYLAAFNSSGTNLWVRQSSANGYVTNRNCRPVLDENSNIYIGGDAFANGTNAFNGYTFINSLATTNAIPFVISLDSNGTNRWATSAGANNFTTGGAIAYTNNTLAIAGAFPYILKWGAYTMETNIGNNGGFYPFVATINASTGNIITLDSLPGSAWDNQSTAITMDKNNNIYTGGRFGEHLYLAGDTIVKGGGDFDWFVAKYGSSNCNCTLPVPNYTFSSNGANTVNFTYTGTTPYTAISWNFGDGSPDVATANPMHSYAVAGTYTVCVTVTNACGSNFSCKTVNTSGTGIGNIPNFAGVRIYPNPATQLIHIENAVINTALELYNVTGNRLLQKMLKAQSDRIDVSGLEPGIYLLRFTDKAGRQGTTKFVKQ